MEEKHGKQFYLSPDLVHRLAAIDIGTNSIRLIVVEPLRGGAYRTLDEEKDSTRLGVSLSKTGLLDATAMEKSLDALRRMKQIAEGYQVSQLKTIATCAVREAKNGEEFCRRAREEIGVDIEIISAKREALLAFFSVQKAFDLTGKHVAVADIGGGSTEIVLAYGNLVEAIYTTQLGAVRFSEIHGSGAGMAGADFVEMVESIDRHLRKHTKNPVFVPHTLFGSGGTFTSLASMVMAAKGQGDMPIRGYNVTRAELRHLLERLRKQPLRERANTPGLSPDRADIIIAGLAIVDRIMERFEVNMLQVHNRGVRDGLVLTMIEESQGPDGNAPRDRDGSIARLMAACGVEIEHSRHVAHLAGLMYDQMVESFQLYPGDRELLESAAQLQDVGYLIDYEQHHKHSYHLIRHSRLAGVSSHELEIIANVARYHRGSRPRRKHSHFGRLSTVDQQRVRTLAAILRVAGGLDRSNTRQVQSVAVKRRGAEALVKVYAPTYPEVDIWGARRRVELFEEVFGVKLNFEWQPVGAPPSTANGAVGETHNRDALPRDVEPGGV